MTYAAAGAGAAVAGAGASASGAVAIHMLDFSVFNMYMLFVSRHLCNKSVARSCESIPGRHFG